MTAHVKYKYLLDIDGNTCTWPHCYELLLSNSVMFKQESKDIQWFYRGILPYEHYVPISNDYRIFLRNSSGQKNMTFL